MDRESRGMDRAREMRKWRERRGGLRRPPPEEVQRSRLDDLLTEWGEEQRKRSLSERTIETRHGHGKRFLRWCRSKDVEEPGWISAGLIDAWLRDLGERRTRKGNPLAEATKEGMIRAIKTFLTFLVERRALEVNPLADYQVRRCRAGRLPTVLDEAAVAAVLAEPDLNDALGIRNRAILELLYSSGVRRAELAKIRTQDLRPGSGLVTVRGGKGNRQRVVPIGRVGLHWIRRYLEEVRPLLEIPEQPSDYLVLTGYGLVIGGQVPCGRHNGTA